MSAVDIFARGGVIHNLASPSCTGALRSAMNNSETDISGQNPNLAQLTSTIRRFSPVRALERLAPHEKSRNGAGRHSSTRERWIQNGTDTAVSAAPRSASPPSENAQLSAARTSSMQRP